MSMADEDKVILGTTGESKAPNAKGPTVGPSTSKRKRSEQNPNEQEEDAPKKRKGGRQPLKNTTKLVSHDEYNTVPREDSTRRKGRVQKIRRHWVRKWFNYKMVHPRYAENFAFHPPQGDYREIGLIWAGEPQQRPPPPPDAHESSTKTPDSYPEEKAKRLKNAEKRAKKAAKDQAKEEENHRLIKSDVKKKKAEGKSEGRSKCKHDPSTAALKKKSTPKKRPAEPVDRNDEIDSSDQDDPPLTWEEVEATPVRINNPLKLSNVSLLEPVTGPKFWQLFRSPINFFSI